MNKEFFKYIPFFGFHSATRKFIEGDSLIEASSVEEVVDGLFNYSLYVGICAENAVAVGGLVYLCS